MSYLTSRDESGFEHSRVTSTSAPTPRLGQDEVFSGLQPDRSR